MATTKRKVFVIVASIMFGLLCIATVSTLIDAITINFTPNSIAGTYQYMQLLTVMSWLTFVFLACLITIIIINFFLQNKFKILEIILTSSLIVLLIVSLILFPTQAPDFNADKTFLIAYFSSFMLMLFVTIIFLVSRILLFYVFKNGVEEQKTGYNKKLKRIMLPILSVLFVIFTFVLIAIPCSLLNKVDIKVNYSYTSNAQYEYSTSYFRVINNSEYDLEYLEIRMIFKDGETQDYNISNLIRYGYHDISRYHESSKLENYKNFSFKILDYSFKAPRYDIISYSMIPLILISGYFIIYLSIKKD